MIKKYLVFLIIVCTSITGYAQNNDNYLLRAQQNYPSHLDSVRFYLEQIETSNLEKEQLWQAQRLTALLEINKGQLTVGINHIIELLNSISIESKSASMVASLNDDLGDIYIQKERSTILAIKYYEEANSIRSIYRLDNELGSSLYRLAAIYLRNAEEELSLEKLNEATSVIRDKKGRLYANVLYLKGVIFGLLAKRKKTYLDSATTYLSEARNIYKSVDPSFFITLSIEDAKLKSQNEDFDSAINGLEEIIQNESLSNEQSIRAYSLLSDAYLNIEDFENAYKYKNLENDSLRFNFAQDRFQQAAEITEDYRTDKQLDQAEETALIQSQKAKTFGIVALILLLVLAISYLIFLQTIQRKKLENLQAVVLGEEQERRRLAKDLHDGIGVLLTSIRMRLSNFEDTVDDQESYHQSLEQIDKACTEVRRVSHNLSPASLEKLGLEEAILDLADQINLSSDLEMSTKVEWTASKLNSEDEVLVYRIIQELINNSLKYAEASKLMLSITEAHESIKLDYSDNGKGFDKQKIKPGIGLKSIASRLDILKGKMSYISQLGKGTHFEISIPING